MYVEKNGVGWYVYIDYFDHWDCLRNGKWEHLTFGVFDNFVKKTDVVLDVGAWIGSTALYLCQKCKTCYALEPDHVAFSKLNANIKLNGFKNIVQYCGALSDKDGIEVLYNNNIGDSSSSSVSKRDRSFRAEAITIESFIKRYKIHKVDFIKMDIEGAENILLPAMANWLRKHKPILYVTIHRQYIRNMKPLTDLLYSIYKNIYYWHSGLADKNDIHEKIRRSATPIVATDKTW